jgi:hypothetical protein
MQPVNASKGVPHLRMNSVGSHSTSGWEKEKIRKGWGRKWSNPDGDLLTMELWAETKKSFKLVWRCYQLLSGFLAKDQLPRVPRQSRLSSNDRVITVHLFLRTSGHESAVG